MNPPLSREIRTGLSEIIVRVFRIVYFLVVVERMRVISEMQCVVGPEKPCHPL
ncbi:hypothetical protein ACGF0J_12675 [Nonomuraea sp. NPDC047897]|uniref:hypothetical protein n=1 Tax=Nonomuraea sp. NPDC047897 TaxID=3364346 RepID=UPI003722D11B